MRLIWGRHMASLTLLAATGAVASACVPGGLGTVSGSGSINIQPAQGQKIAPPEPSADTTTTTKSSPSQSSPQTFSDQGQYDRQGVPRGTVGDVGSCAGQLVSTFGSQENTAQHPNSGYGTIYLTNRGSVPCDLANPQQWQMWLQDSSNQHLAGTRSQVDMDTSALPENILLGPGDVANISVDWWTVAYQGTTQGCLSQTPSRLAMNVTPNKSGMDVPDAAVPINNSSGSPVNVCQDGLLHIVGVSAPGIG
jgi:hypothetical protein